jgi:NADH dehydrogenase FAD-containing subunit
VIYTHKDKATGETAEKRIPSNMVLWSTGIAMNPFTRRVCDLLPNQVHKKACSLPILLHAASHSIDTQAIEVDSYLRVKGAPLGTVYALGDSATVS